MGKQQIIVSIDVKRELNEICTRHQINKLLLVCDASFESMKVFL